MNDFYVHTLRCQYSERGNRHSRTMFPISYGPFKDQEAAWERIRQRGITGATRLMERPATENIELPPGNLSGSQNLEQSGSRPAKFNPVP